MASARLLDLTRLVSRLGRGPMTGIDRVELAYLHEFLRQNAPMFGLVRTAAGWLLLDRKGCQSLAATAVSAAPLPGADLLSRLLNRKDPLRARAEAVVRRLAVARAARPGLARLMRRLPPTAAYFNIGHANLTMSGLGTLKAAGLSITVMIHDTIPLDHPEFARPDTVDPFRRKLAAVSAHASRVIHLAQATRAQTDAQLAQLGRTPPGLVAPLGVEVARPYPASLPPGLDLTLPFFVAIGTIEPRKNHALLLDVWAQLPAPQPRLYLIGNRGWADRNLLARLDALPPDGPVHHLQGLGDGAVAALLANARALLAPSLAEGFGLPPVEAASLGTPVIATDLPVTREILGDKAVYLPGSDIYSWVETIARQTGRMQTGDDRRVRWTAPSWDDHFNKVLNLD